MHNDGGAVFTADLLKRVARPKEGPAMINVLIVDDDFMVAKVHAGFIQRTPGFAVVGAAHTGAAGARWRPPGCSRTWSCWTSTCPTSTGWT